MTNLTEKFTALEQQLATQHTAVLAQLAGINAQLARLQDAIGTRADCGSGESVIGLLCGLQTAIDGTPATPPAPPFTCPGYDGGYVAGNGQWMAGNGQWTGDEGTWLPYWFGAVGSSVVTPGVWNIMYPVPCLRNDYIESGSGPITVCIVWQNKPVGATVKIARWSTTDGLYYFVVPFGQGADGSDSIDITGYDPVIPFLSWDNPADYNNEPPTGFRMWAASGGVG